MPIEIPQYQAQYGITDRGPNVRLDTRLAGTSALTMIGEAGSALGDFAEQKAAEGWERRNTSFASAQRASIARALTEHRIAAEREASEGAPGFVTAEDQWFADFRAQRMAEAQALADQGGINAQGLDYLGSTLDQAETQHFGWAATFADAAETAQLEVQFGRTMDDYAAAVASNPAALETVRAQFEADLAAAAATWMRPETVTAMRETFDQQAAEAALMSVARAQPQAVINQAAGGGWGDPGSAYTDWLLGQESGGRADIMNAQGYVGLAQWGEAALATLGVYTDDVDLADNDWTGRFVIDGFPEVRTVADFRASEPAQRAVLTRWLGYQRDVIAERGWLAAYGGQVIGGVRITEAALMAGMHLGGPGGVADFLASGGARDPADANGTHVSDYMRAAQDLPLESALGGQLQGALSVPANQYQPAPYGGGQAPAEGVSVVSYDPVARLAVAAGPAAANRAAAEAERTQAEQRAMAQGQAGPRVEAEMALLRLGLEPPADRATDAEIDAAFGLEAGAALRAERAAAYEAQAEVARLRNATPAQMAEAVARYDARAADPGVDSLARAEALRRADALRTALYADNGILATRSADPIGFLMADNPDIAAAYQAALEGGASPEAMTRLRIAADAAVTLQRLWGVPEAQLRRLPEAFTTQWLAAWDGGTPDQQLVQLGALTGAFGGQAPAVLGELRGARPEIAHLGGLMAAGSAPATLVDALAGLRVAAADRITPAPADRVPGTAATLGGAFGRAGDTNAQVVAAAEAIFHARAAREGLDTSLGGDHARVQTVWARALQEAAGARFDTDGTQWGGVTEHNGIRVAVPADIPADAFAGLVDDATAADFAAASGADPTHGAGGAGVTDEEIRGGYWVAIDDGRYIVAMSPPWTAAPGWLAGDGDNGFFVVDIRVLRDRAAARAAGGGR